VQPLVLGFHITGELPALGFPPGNVVLDLEQAVRVDDALFDGGGHAALLLDSLVRTPQVSVLNRRPQRPAGPSLELAFLLGVRCIQVRCFLRR